MFSRKANTETGNHCMEYTYIVKNVAMYLQCNQLVTIWQVIFHMYKLSWISWIGSSSQLRKIHSRTLYNVQLLFAIVVSVEFGDSIIFAKINVLDPRDPLSNKHISAAANTDVIATVGAINICHNQTQICWQKEACITTTYS